MFRKTPALSNAMIQQNDKSVEKPRVPTLQDAQLKKNPNLTASNQVVEHFSFKLQEAVSQTDQTIAWNYNVPILSPNQKYLYLATDSFTTVILDYVGDNFPQTISIALKSFSGFISKQGVQTNKIIILNLFQVSSTITAQGIQYRDLVYKSEMNTMWQLGSLRNLEFQVYLDDETTPLTFPITNPINITFKILHLAI